MRSPDLRLTNRQWEEMREVVARHAPLEACGLIAGRDGQASSIIPVTNELHSPVRYRMSPAGQLAAFLQMERENQELLAIFHSHPAGPDRPSATDVEEAYYPEAIYLIWFAERNEWQCQGFWIQGGEVRPATLLVTEEGN